MRKSLKVLFTLIGIQVLFTYFVLPYGWVRPLIFGQIPFLIFYLLVMNLVAFLTLVFLVRYAEWGEMEE
ncbi:MAG: hypothetical protein NZ920_00080 [Aigarchaeota archaeon]|nr:hypothetical protein [Aigarchaeota archaeon]MDW8092792.1 hypothetical protein [Nitrososphaerota archaeon]